jgi:hypothetical protein
MFDYLRSIEPHVAAGVLAQAALRLEGSGLASEGHLIENQAEVEQSVLNELRYALGLQPEDWSTAAVQLLTEALDRETERLDRFHVDASLDRLSAEGLLASDVYEIFFEPHLSQNFGWRWGIESELATRTIRQPHREQVLGGSRDGADLPKVTIFARYFANKYPARSFWLLAIGARAQTTLSVPQVWRVYPNEVDLSQCETLLDVLKAFSDKYGDTIELAGQRGKFFFRADASLLPSGGTVEIPRRLNVVTTVTLFHAPSAKGSYVFLVVPIDLTKYIKAVEYWRGWDKAILSDLSLTAVASPPPPV